MLIGAEKTGSAANEGIKNSDPLNNRTRVDNNVYSNNTCINLEVLDTTSRGVDMGRETERVANRLSKKVCYTGSRYTFGRKIEAGKSGSLDRDVGMYWVALRRL